MIAQMSIAQIGFITAMANMDLHRYGEWQCDYSSMYQEILKEYEAAMSIDKSMVKRDMNKPTGYMAECPDCKNVVAAWSYDEEDSREEIGLMIGDWVMAGLTVKPIRGTSVMVQSYSCKDL